MAASSAQAQNKKIKPINHPNLLLKTPIAYHGVSDLSVLPIDKDGIAVCEKCGAIGVKHAFYTRQRKFCSVLCARGYTDRHGAEELSDAGYRFRLMESGEALVGRVPLEPLPRLPSPWRPAAEDAAPAPRVPPLTHRWASRDLFRRHFQAAPVRLFAHAPLADMWDRALEGMKVEVRNADCEMSSEYFWVATVLQLKGYMGLLRYEGFDGDSSRDFWVNLMACEVYPVGWCATRGIPLIPPRSVEGVHSDWKGFLVRRLTGARTLPADFYLRVREGSRSRFRLGHVLEVVDKNRLSRVKVAVVDDMVEKRLHLRYYSSAADGGGFWCHEDSPLLHPVGWARAVQHELDAPADYPSDPAPADYTTPDMFREPRARSPPLLLRQGDRLEAVDPLNLSSICEATVMRVLLRGYVMIRIDCYPPDEAGADWFCYHETSPCIFPPGFCAENGIALTSAPGAPVLPPARHASSPQVPSRENGFVEGMRLECTDLMEPRLVCVATVARVVGRLLRVHFDGWGEEYDQWLDCESSDIFPVGWCGAVGHRLEGPPGAPQAQRRRPRKKKGLKPLAPPQEMSIGKEEQAQEITMKEEVEEPAEVPEVKAEVKAEAGEVVEEAWVPRLAGSALAEVGAADPGRWRPSDVVRFLALNDCAPYSVHFAGVDGPRMLALSKDEIIELLHMKVGPSLKIFHLIQQLKCKLKPPLLH